MATLSLPAAARPVRSIIESTLRLWGHGGIVASVLAPVGSAVVFPAAAQARRSGPMVDPIVARNFDKLGGPTVAPTPGKWRHDRDGPGRQGSSARTYGA
jgi:hypothetical protein